MIRKFRYQSKFTGWLCRVLLSFNILIPGFLHGDISHVYPLNVLAITMIAFWLYLYKLRIAAIPVLSLMAFINYQHIIS